MHTQVTSSNSIKNKATVFCRISEVKPNPLAKIKRCKTQEFSDKPCRSTCCCFSNCNNQCSFSDQVFGSVRILLASASKTKQPWFLIIILVFCYKQNTVNITKDLKSSCMPLEYLIFCCNWGTPPYHNCTGYTSKKLQQHIQK